MRRTLRLVQGIAALLRSKFLQVSCSNDRTCNIVFTARWANNAHVVNCGRDLFCIGTADGAVHVLAPVVCDLMPQGMRTAPNEAPRSQRVRRPMGPGSTRRVQVRSRALHNHAKRIRVPDHLETGLMARPTSNTASSSPTVMRTARLLKSIRLYMSGVSLAPAREGMWRCAPGPTKRADLGKISVSHLRGNKATARACCRSACRHLHNEIGLVPRFRPAGAMAWRVRA